MIKKNWSHKWSIFFILQIEFKNPIFFECISPTALQTCFKPSSSSLCSLAFYLLFSLETAQLSPRINVKRLNCRKYCSNWSWNDDVRAKMYLLVLRGCVGMILSDYHSRAQPNTCQTDWATAMFVMFVLIWINSKHLSAAHRHLMITL